MGISFVCLGEIRKGVESVLLVRERGGEGVCIYICVEETHKNKRKILLGKGGKIY